MSRFISKLPQNTGTFVLCACTLMSVIVHSLHFAANSERGRDEMEYSVENPQFEVVLRVAGSEVCILGGFPREDGSIDILVGVDEVAFVEEYAALVEHGVLALRSARNWASAPSSHLPEPPF